MQVQVVYCTEVAMVVPDNLWLQKTMFPHQHEVSHNIKESEYRATEQYV